MDTVGPFPILTNADKVQDTPEYTRQLAYSLSNHIQRFRVGVPVSGSSFGNVKVTFDPPFDEIPTVVASTMSTPYFASITNTSTTQVTIWARHHAGTTATSTVYVDVIATDI